MTVLSTGVTSTADANQPYPNWVAPTGGVWRIGNDSFNEPWTGDIAAVAYWRTALTGTQISSLVTDYGTWLGLGPAAMWILDQTSTATAVTDLVGTANQTSLTATSVVLDASPMPPFSRTFDPTTPTGCSIWLDASDASTFTFSSGSTVSAWRDKSGSARHTQTAAVSPVRGTVSLNGKPTVSFNGAAQVYTNNPGSYLTGTAVTAVAVCADHR